MLRHITADVYSKSFDIRFNWALANAAYTTDHTQPHCSLSTIVHFYKHSADVCMLSESVFLNFTIEGMPICSMILVHSGHWICA